jgi:hypothetical protein
MVTRLTLVVKKWGFLAQNGDENRSRRQKMGISQLKMVTRLTLVVKKWGFSTQSGDEIEARRQKMKFPSLKW